MGNKETSAEPSASKKTTKSRRSGAARTRARREHDLVLFGATGFTGSLVADYLARNAPARTRVALAGRSEEKLASVKQSLSGPAHHWPLLVADAQDPDSLAPLAAASKAIISTVGPYNKYGVKLVGACAAAGTHYADLTGEVLFMRRSIDEFNDLAKSSGARIVHSCGFDSIPSDLGVLALHLSAKEDDGKGHLTDTHFLVRKLRGGFSGGTVASGINEIELARGTKGARKVLADPYALSPDRSAEPTPGDSRDSLRVRYDDVVGSWVGPFLMGPINTRVVRRSNALLDYAYGQGFRYDEGSAFGSGLSGRLGATAMLAGTAAIGGVMQVEPGRKLAARFLPSPGEGPNERTRQKGMFIITIHTRTPAGARYQATVAADGDPGYIATSLMLGRAGLVLAGDQRRLPRRAGVLTPATGMGLRLIEELKSAGMTINTRKI